MDRPPDLAPGRQLSLAVQIDGTVRRVVVSVVRLEEIPRAAAGRSTRKLSRAQVEQASHTVRDHLSECVRLSAVASVVGFSPCQFSRAFHASTGTTFRAYLMRVRIDEAMRLMRETEMSLRDVAIESGFGDQSSFSRAFARIQGTTPFRWRRLARHDVRDWMPAEAS
jgi:transcriptional regulator GlxA family with amidase domain